MVMQQTRQHHGRRHRWLNATTTLTVILTMGYAAMAQAQTDPSPKVVQPTSKPLAPRDMATGDLAKILAEQATMIDQQSGDVDYCDTLLPIVEELRRRVQDDKGLARLRRYSMYECAIKEKRHTDAYAMLPELEQKDGVVFVPSHVAWLAFEVKAYDDGVRTVEAQLKKDGIGEIHKSTFWYFVRQLNDAKRQDLRERLFVAMEQAAGYKERRSDFADGIASARFSDAVERKDFDRAGVMLLALDHPANYVDWLADKKYQPLWAQMEERAGPQMRKITAAHAANISERYAQDTTNRGNRQTLIHALYYAGRYQEVLDLTQSIDQSDKGLAALDEDNGWALNLRVYALDMLRRDAEAELLFDRIVAANAHTANTNFWMVNFAINRGSRLVQLGKYQKGYDAMLLADKFEGSPYAKMLIRRGKICALHKLGRGKEAEALLADAYAQRKDAVQMAASAHLCAGNEDRAAAIIIEGLSDETTRQPLLGQFQQNGFDFPYTRSTLPQVYDTLRKRPDVTVAFEKYGRDIPEKLVPIAPELR